MANPEYQYNYLETRSKYKTIIDRSIDFRLSLMEQLERDCKENLYKAFIEGFQCGQKDVSKEVLKWIKEGA